MNAYDETMVSRVADVLAACDDKMAPRFRHVAQARAVLRYLGEELVDLQLDNEGLRQERDKLGQRLRDRSGEWKLAVHERDEARATLARIAKPTTNDARSTIRWTADKEGAR